MAWLERQTAVGARGNERREVAVLGVVVDKRLGQHEAAREGHVELAGIGLAPQLNGGLLGEAVAQFALAVHEDRGYPVVKVAVEIGVAREMHPTELLNR